jgi:16S rRNA (cytidine1402-2'-O)-methyltransferase
MLYLVPTPIGNLKDITIRALEILQEVEFILAEDTRVTAKLLQHYGIDTPTRSYHAHNEHKLTPQIIQQLKKGSAIALVTDAGTPAISDPGFLLVRACYENEVRVIPLPGACALITGLSASGLPSDRFHFEGFLPHKKGRNKRLEFLKTYPYSIVLYESPYRLLKTIQDIQDIYDDKRQVCLAKELSKIHEAFLTDYPSELLPHLDNGQKIKGEYVLIIAPEEK